ENQNYFDGLNLRNTGALRYSTKLSSMFTPMVQITGSIGTAALFLYGAYLLNSGAITIGVIVAFSNYIGNFWQPISRLGQVYNQLLRAMASSERIHEYLSERPQIKEKKHAKPMKITDGNVTFDH